MITYKKKGETKRKTTEEGSTEGEINLKPVNKCSFKKIILAFSLFVCLFVFCFLFCLPPDFSVENL